MIGLNKKLLLLFCILSMAKSMVFGQTVSDIVDQIRRGQIDEAKQTLLKIEENIPPERALFLHGLLSTNGDSAAFYYERLLMNHPECTYCDDALFRLAQLKYARGLYKTSVQTFHQIITDYPRSHLHQKSHYWIGLCYKAMEETDSASVYFRIAVDNYPHTEMTQHARQDMDALSENESAEPEESTPVSSIHWAVQIGAFSHQANALLRKSFFEKEGYHVDLRTKMREGSRLYMVWLGSFETRDEAKQFGERLKKRYGVSYTLVSE